VEAELHPLYRSLVLANAAYSYDRERNHVTLFGRRISEQIAVLEMLRSRGVVSKKELLTIFGDNEMALLRYLNPLEKIGLLRKERDSTPGAPVVSYHFANTVELKLAEESRRVQWWLAEKPQNGNWGAVTLETPVGFLKLQPTEKETVA
jgi:hypothetical protein